MTYRQGDVQLTRVDKLPEGLLARKERVLFYGEVTGHKHSIDIGELFETKNGNLYLKVDALTKVSHEEHKTVAIPVGIYLVTQKRQYNEESGWERVQD